MVILSWYNENTEKSVIGLFGDLTCYSGFSIKSLYNNYTSEIMRPHSRTPRKVHSKGLWKWENDNAN